MSKSLEQPCAKKRKTDVSIRKFLNPLFTLRTGSFEIVLIIDKGEISHSTDSTKDISRRLREKELRSSGLSYEIRSLKVGDFAWIAREKAEPHRELVLDWLVERKRIDDLFHSTQRRDGRSAKSHLNLCCT